MPLGVSRDSRTSRASTSNRPESSTQASPAEGETRNRIGKASPVRRHLLAILRTVTVVALGVGVWQILSIIFGTVLLPTPLMVAKVGWHSTLDGYLATNAWASLKRVLIGFGLGSLVAIPVGFLMGWYGWVRKLVDPYIQFFRMIPPLALIPMAIVLFGIGEVPKILVLFLAAFLSCVIATYQGVLDVDKTLIDAARVLGANDRTIFRRVVVPASSPYILVGMRIGLASAWGTLVAAELIAAQLGLGRMLAQAELFFDMSTIVVGVITIGILGLLMDQVIRAVERRVTRWQPRR